jgi:hypothetical protein
MGNKPDTRLEDLIGCTGYKGPAKSLDEMEAGVAEGARRALTAEELRQLKEAPGKLSTA